MMPQPPWGKPLLPRMIPPLRFRVTVLLTLALPCAPLPVGAQSAYEEGRIVLQALEDKLRHDTLRDTVFLLPTLLAHTADANDSSTWTASLLRFTRGVSPALLHSYWRANRTSTELVTPAILGGHPIRRISEQRETTLQQTGGIYSVSRVGFNARRDSALVTVSFACPGLCGTDILYLYVKSVEGWEKRRNLIQMDR